MSLDINIDHNFDDLKEYLNEMKTKAVVQSARRAINRSLVTGRLESGKLIRKELRIKARELKKNHIRIKNAKGGNLRTLEGILSFNTRGLPMLPFVKGSKQPRKQKGIPVRRRSKIKVEVKPGKQITMPKIFIAKTNGKNRVFRRQGPQGKLYRQHVPSVSHFFDTKGGIKDRTIKILQRRFTEVFQQDLSFRLQKLKAKRLR